MKWSIIVDINVDNINDFLNSYVVNGSIQIRNEHVKGIVCCEEDKDEQE